MGTIRKEDIDEVDDFLASAKTLDGGYPDWIASSWPNELQAIWNVRDELDIIRGHLRFRLLQSKPQWPSVSLIFGTNAIYRVDFEDESIRKRNPIWAQGLGLPAQIAGSHCHAWEHNKDHIIRSGEWELPAREQLAAQLRHLHQAIPWLADRVKIELTPEQRGFEIPSRAELFEWNRK